MRGVVMALATGELLAFFTRNYEILTRNHILKTYTNARWVPTTGFLRDAARMTDCNPRSEPP